MGGGGLKLFCEGTESGVELLAREQVVYLVCTCYKQYINEPAW